ncbi:MAG: hypothetical protein M1398_03315 [Deltaproteobacteria bacterium]|nr:hypothetical protein [Deltaproteobacteria bacterium]MDA8306091.1 hypothetical protein [Deltaproteobacteria bacterium]
MLGDRGKSLLARVRRTRGLQANGKNKKTPVSRRIFDSRIRQMLDCMHNNPVKAGSVCDLVDRPFSSARSDMSRKPVGMGNTPIISVALLPSARAIIPRATRERT